MFNELNKYKKKEFSFLDQVISYRLYVMPPKIAVAFISFMLLTMNRQI